MRIFETPEWLQPMTCVCGGEVILQPWDNFVSDKDVDSRVGCRNSIIGLNFICLGCKKQFHDNQLDWGHVVNDEKFDELFYRLFPKQGE